MDPTRPALPRSLSEPDEELPPTHRRFPSLRGLRRAYRRYTHRVHLPFWLRDPAKDPRTGALYAARLVVQAGLMGLAVVLIFSVLSDLRSAVIGASLASSAFIVFMVPRSRTADSKSVLGSHLLAIPSGLLAHTLLPQTALGNALVFGGAVLVTTLLMEATATAHPPAAATALGVSLAPEAVPILSVALAAAFLAALHTLLEPHLVDLVEVPDEDAPARVAPAARPSESS